LSWLAPWAAGRSISPNSLSGTSLLLALCAAVWFSGGAHDGTNGMIAMVGWLLGLVAAHGLAVHTGHQRPETVPSFGWIWTVCGAAAECAIYGGMAAGSQPTVLIGIWPLAVTVVISIATGELLGACLRAALGAGDPPQAGRAAVIRWTGKLLALPAGPRGLLALVAFAVAGAAAALFAVLALEVVAVVTTIAMLGKITPARRGIGRPVTASAVPAGAANAIAVRTASAVRAEPAPDRPVAALSAAAGLRRRATSTAVGAPASPAQARATRVTAVVGVAGSPGATSSVRLILPSVRGAAGEGEGPVVSSWAGGSGAAGRSLSADAGGGAEHVRPPHEAGAAVTPDVAMTPDVAVTHDAAVQRAARGATAQDVILALRDDGAAARWAGRLVQGNLIPLPPALGGLVATVLLAILGLRNLPGFIALTPPVVMMLAAPGSSNRHERRFDWLVPVLLALAQFVYLATLGFALRVPGPVVFSAIALILVWYASVIAGVGGGGAGRAAGGTGEAAIGVVSGDARSAHGAFLGWETRMFTVGLAAALGLAIFGYLGLAAYLGVLICRRLMTG
jgi:hypothetical protein